MCTPVPFHPPLEGLTIVSATSLAPNTPCQVKLRFSGPIAYDHESIPEAMHAQTDMGEEEPDDVMGSGSDWIILDFPDSVLPGSAWTLTGAMAGITPSVKWPQSGSVG